MKVGILTYHWVANFGANLQTLSTFNYLKKRGDEPVVINWIPKDLEKIYVRNTSAEQMETHRDFARSHYTTTEVCRTSAEIAEVIRNHRFDLIIVGSDAVLAYIPVLQRLVISRRGLWYSKPAIDSDFPNPFWGDFIPKIPKTPVALMSGSAQHTNFNLIVSKAGKKKFSQALRQFSYVSVRDSWTKKMVNYLSNKAIDPPITPDPVFAFNHNHPAYLTKEQILQRFHLPEKYILVTASRQMLNDDWTEQMEKLFSDDGFVAYELPRPDGLQKLKLKNSISLPVSPLEWYYLIKYSGGYIGELMHPVLVSLHNAVPFFSLDTYGIKKGSTVNLESSKIFHILNKYGLLNNYYSTLQQEKFPTPGEVCTAIQSFDRKRCEEKSATMYDEYQTMMEDLFRSCSLSKTNDHSSN